MVELTVKPNSFKTHFYVADVIPISGNKTVAALMHLSPKEASEKKKLSEEMEQLGKKLNPKLPHDEWRKIRDDLIELDAAYHHITGPEIFYELKGTIPENLRVGLVLEEIPKNAVVSEYVNKSLSVRRGLILK